MNCDALRLPRLLIYNTEDSLLMTRDGLRNVTGSGSYDGGTAWAGQISDRQRLVPLLLPTSLVPLNLLTHQDGLSHIYTWHNTNRLTHSLIISCTQSVNVHKFTPLMFKSLGISKCLCIQHLSWNHHEPDFDILIKWQQQLNSFFTLNIRHKITFNWKS